MIRFKAKGALAGLLSLLFLVSAFCREAVLTKAADSETVQLTVGEEIAYEGYSTNYFYINGKLAYCLEPSKATPGNGQYAAEVLAQNAELAKVLYYGYGGPGEMEFVQRFSRAWQFPDVNISGLQPDKERYCYTHMYLSWVYSGYNFDAAFFGTNISPEHWGNMYYEAEADFRQIRSYLADISVPTGRLSFSSGGGQAWVDGDRQRTDSIRLEADPGNSVTLSLPEYVTLFNETTGVSATGTATVKGGEQFYLWSDLANNYGTWESGTITGAIDNSWKSLIIGSYGGAQAVGGGSYVTEPQRTASLSVKWVDLGRIRLTKVSGSAKETNNNPYYSLAGAVYEVFDGTRLVDTLTTDASGNAQTKLLPYGDYTVKEKESPTGYLVEAAAHSAKVNALEVPVKSVEEPQRTKILIQKRDAEKGQSSPQGAATLAGAKYKITHVESGITETVTTDESGNAVMKQSFPLGHCTVREVEPPKGYLLDPNIYTMEITSTDRATVLFEKIQEVQDDIIRGNIQLVKFKESGNEDEEIKTPLEGISFTITSKTTGETVRTITTDKNGYADTKDRSEPRGGLIYDTYIVSEVPSGRGDIKVAEPFEVTVKEEGVTLHYIIENKQVTSPVMVVKKDAGTGRIIPVAGTEFRLLDAKKKPITMTTYYPKKTVHKTFMTDESGSFTFPEKLESGIYYLEEVQAPHGYLKGELLKFQVKEGHIWENPLIITYENEPAMGQIAIRKTDEETKEVLAGAEFQITAKEDIITGDGTVRVSAGEVVAQLLTNAKGEACTDLLFPGVYEVKETKAPEGYVTKEEPETVVVAYENQDTPIVYVEHDITNKKITPEEEKAPKAPSPKTGDTEPMSSEFAGLSIALLSGILLLCRRVLRKIG